MIICVCSSVPCCVCVTVCVHVCMCEYIQIRTCLHKTYVCTYVRMYPIPSMSCISNNSTYISRIYSSMIDPVMHICQASKMHLKVVRL